MALQRTQFRQIILVDTEIDDDDVFAKQQGNGSFLYEQISGDTLKKIITALNKDVRLMSNVGLSVVANAPTNGLTIALKQADGTDPATAHKNKCVIEFRSSTLASGAVVFREVTAALSTVISSGSTAGFFAAKAEKLHFYLIDNAGTVELAWSGSETFDESALQSTTAEGGAGAADSKTVLYSTTARSNVAIRYVGYALLTEATPGTWVTNPTQIVVGKPARTTQGHSVTLATGNGHGSTNTKVRRFTSATVVGTALTHATSSTAGDSITVNEDGFYTMRYLDYNSGGNGVHGMSINSAQLTTNLQDIAAANRLAAQLTPTTTVPNTASITLWLQVGDVIRPHTNGSVDATTNAMFVITKIG
jgi:hypothetical protein